MLWQNIWVGNVKIPSYMEISLFIHILFFSSLKNSIIGHIYNMCWFVTLTNFSEPTTLECFLGTIPSPYDSLLRLQNLSKQVILINFGLGIKEKLVLKAKKLVSEMKEFLVYNIAYQLKTCTRWPKRIKYSLRWYFHLS